DRRRERARRRHHVHDHPADHTAPHLRRERSMSRVLIVEDEPALADSIRYGLEREGYECTVLNDGLRAVDYVRSWRPDIVLLDLMLPGMPGTDVCREIRTIGQIPIVMVTAKDTEADKVLGLELGADDYITKPFS